MEAIIQKIKKHWITTILIVFVVFVIFSWAFISVFCFSIYNESLKLLFGLTLAVSAGFAAYKVPIELKETFKWRKTETAKKLHDDFMLHERAINARKMLDYQHGRKYDISKYFRDVLPPHRK